MLGHQIVIEDESRIGPRLKYSSQTADVAYWTALWGNIENQDYSRDLKGHQPHQLAATFHRWVKPGARVLEAGCGVGRFTVAAHARGYVAEGLDWSTETVLALRRRFPDIPWHIGDVRALEFADGEFDAVYSPGVVEHFEEGPEEILEETRRILRPGGITIISTPCFNPWMQRHPDRFASTSKPVGDFYQYAFSQDGMKGTLTDLGFEVVQVRPYGTLDTLMRYGNWRIPGPAVGLLALALDYVPIIDAWGSTCIWVGRKR